VQTKCLHNILDNDKCGNANGAISMCYEPPCENSLSPSALNASASTSPFIFNELIHSFDYKTIIDNNKLQHVVYSIQLFK